MGEPGEVFDLVCPSILLFGGTFKSEAGKIPGVVLVTDVPLLGLTGKGKSSGAPVP
jgi:hypothetical protein